jgi:TolB-like protein/tetratricopeptide (TPR) repeat protein
MASQIGELAPTPESPVETSSAPRASIVVLPFVNLGSDRDEDCLVDGITETLITDLWRIPHTFVIARNTAFSYKGKTLDARRIGRELGVRYVLEGSVQPCAELVRVHAQLTDTDTAAQLWAVRIDCPRGALFEMQDSIVTQLARAMSTEIVGVEARRSSARTTDPDAVDFLFRAWDTFNRAQSPDSLAEAERLFSQAIALSPRTADALVGMAHVKFALGATYAVAERALHLAAAEAAATRALEIDPNEPRAHGILGWIYAATNRPLLAIAHSERAVQLTRTLASAYAAIGWAKLMLGRAEETEADIAKAFRRCPKDTFAYVWCYIAGTAKLSLGRTHDAVAWLARSIELNRAYPISHFMLAAALAQQGRLDDAHAAAAAGLALAPGFTIQRYREGASSDNVTYLALRERIYEGLRIAGIPEGEAERARADEVASASRLSTFKDFSIAVKQALLDFNRPDLFAHNALLETRILIARGSSAPSELKALIADTVGELFKSAQDEKLRRVIDVTYLRGVPKQEAAAERLGLSFSTYRRYLATGRNRLSRWLWEKEQALRTAAS